MWNYPDLTHAPRVRAEFQKDPEWQAFVAGNTPKPLEMQSGPVDADAVLADALTPWPAGNARHPDRGLAAREPGRGVAPRLGRRRCNPNSCS